MFYEVFMKKIPLVQETWNSNFKYKKIIHIITKISLVLVNTFTLHATVMKGNIAISLISFTYSY